MNEHRLERSCQRLRRRLPTARPVCGLILGSGLGPAASVFRVRRALPYSDFSPWAPAGVEGHDSRLLWADLEGLETFVFCGRRHWYEGMGWEPVALPVHLLKRFGAEMVLLTSASGGIRSGFNPGDWMLLDDHINGMGAHPLHGPHHPFWGPRFPDLGRTYDPSLALHLVAAARRSRVRLRRGTYMAVAGPCYETPAEIRAFRTLGADAVGMSTVPEAILAHAAGLRVAGLTLITNVAGAKPGSHTVSHAEVLTNAAKAVSGLSLVLKAFWKLQAHSRTGSRRSARP